MKVVSLSSVQVSELEEIFQEEICLWRDQLFWDLTPAIELIRRYIFANSLPGYVLRDTNGSILGYSYYVVSRPVGYIGNLFLRTGQADEEKYRRLLEPTLASLKSWSDVTRIECQVFSFNCDFSPLFRRHSFQIMKRYFMVLPVEETGPYEPQPCREGFRVSRWDRSFFFPAAEVIFDSYVGSPDANLCRDYQSLEGCVRFLRNLVDHPGCGTFMPETSYVVTDPAGEVAAVLVTSRISDDTGMIPQVSVKRKYQERGLGTVLLKTYLCASREHGLKRISLSVSESNQRAYKLYLRLGFHPLREFHAFIWDGRSAL